MKFFESRQLSTLPTHMPSNLLKEKYLQIEEFKEIFSPLIFKKKFHWKSLKKSVLSKIIQTFEKKLIKKVWIFMVTWTQYLKKVKKKSYEMTTDLPRQL